MTRLVKAVLICGFVLSTIGLLSYNRSSHSAEISPSELAMYKATEQAVTMWARLVNLPRGPVQKLLTYFPCQADEDQHLEGK